MQASFHSIKIRGLCVNTSMQACGLYSTFVSLSYISVFSANTRCKVIFAAACFRNSSAQF